MRLLHVIVTASCILSLLAAVTAAATLEKVVQVQRHIDDYSFCE